MFGEQITHGTEYIYPNGGEVDYFAAAGMNLIRLPFHWENLQPALGGELDAMELARIRDFVDTVSAL